MSQTSPQIPGDDTRRAALNSFWTASRGAQTINCELIVHAHGHPVLRCAYGPHAVIRSQAIASEDAAAAVAEIWKMALLEQGFQIQPRHTDS